MSQENNFVPQQGTYKPLRPFPLFVKSNFPFIEATFESLDNYGLYCKVVEYLNTVIANENIVEDNVRALYNAFISLNDYVSNYFDNLDVQEEINNKLDDMVEQGTLQEIIADYLNSKAVFGFDTVASMKDATNLIDGSYAKTMGYYQLNDGGNALYKITENEPSGHYEILDSGLYAELIYINNQINIKQLGCKADNQTDNSQLINNAIKDNISIYIPEGVFIADINITKKYVEIIGNGTIKGSITIETPITSGDQIEECYVKIKNIKFTKNNNLYAIHLINARIFTIDNIYIDNTFDFGIYYSEASLFSQRVARGIIINNEIKSKYGLYLVDSNTLGCADITFSNNILQNTLTNVYMKGIDGFKDNGNTYFMPSYNQQNPTKEYNFYCEKINWLTINGSTFFEAGLDAIHLEKFQNVNISGNLIGWCGQRVASSGIYLGDYDVANGLYNISNINNNIITFPTLHGINVTTNTGRISIDNNRIQGEGVGTYYYGNEDLSSITHYCINYPLVNENMYCSVTNNVSERRENNISQRIFQSNNITNSSTTGKKVLFDTVTVSDTFTSGSSTSKTLSYSTPTGYRIANVRCKEISPTSHAVQYDINYFGNYLLTLKNNYESNLTTSFTFEIEFIKNELYQDI